MRGHIIIYNDRNVFQIYTDDGEKVDEYELKDIIVENYHAMSGDARIIEEIIKKHAEIRRYA
ncbi:MAG TPA: hypothetical protein PLW88_07325 [Syntrophorhabdaceae bacterium]|nr:hypothetical protein [Syntrophorhabdaceae bacterium]HPP07168.1 hypothetical protein [Syntrophorhabdaceae bacterium]